MKYTYITVLLLLLINIIVSIKNCKKDEKENYYWGGDNTCNSGGDCVSGCCNSGSCGPCS